MGGSSGELKVYPSRHCSKKSSDLEGTKARKRENKDSKTLIY